MKIATWNVNSLKVRLGHLLEWLSREHPDVVCLQETKTENASFPQAELAAAGYRAVYSGQRTYNGVAILSNRDAADVVEGIPGFEDEQRRVLSATFDGVRIVCAYVPNGQSVGSDKYQYKLRWFEAFRAWLRSELPVHSQIAVLGDYNVAPADEDVHDPKAWEGQVLVSEPERAAFRSLLGEGFKDGFRLFDQPSGSFSWWDYRMNAFRRKMGLRIDHILLSEALAPACTSCRIDAAMRALERPSDHAPVIAELAVG